MLADLHNPNTGRRGRVYICNGCRGRTRIIKADSPLPDGWTDKTEINYSNKGLSRRGSGFVINYYCRYCSEDGITARIIAMVLRRQNGKGPKIVR